MTNISTEFKKTNIQFDRSTDVKNELPYDSSYYHIQPNELAYYKTFNTKISYLYDNLMYVYSRCFIPNFAIPSNSEGFIGVNVSQNIGVYSNNSTSYNFASAGYPELDNVKNFIAYSQNGKNYLLFNSLTSISILEHNLNSNSVSHKSKITLIDPLSGEIAFQKINQLTTNGDYLYVSEGSLDIVYKYNLQKYFSNENIYKNKLFLEESVGGEGGRYDPIKFDNPNNISYFNNTLLVEDFGNKTVKFFQNDLNFLSYSTIINLYSQLTSFSVIKFQNENNIIGATKNGFYNFKFENNRIKSNEFVSLSSFLESNEEVIDINFSGYEKNIIYILTNQNIYKKWNFGSLKVIGKKSASDFGANSSFKSFYTISNTISSDLFYVYTNNSQASANQILIYDDNLDLISALNNPEFTIYSREETLVKKQEYDQHWVYNKNLRKLVKNYDLLKNNVSYKFVLEYDANGVPNYIGRIYNTEVLDYPKFDYDTTYVVGVNENFQASVINREFDEIYNFGKDLLDNVLSNVNNTLNLNPSAF
jgi:hypothetical protein